MTRRTAALGACALLIGLSGCIATRVSDLGGGRYLMQGGGGAFHSGPQVTQEMITKAHAYCAARGKRAVIDLDHQVQKDGVYQNYGFGVTRVEKAHGQVTFQCEGDAAITPVAEEAARPPAALAETPEPSVPTPRDAIEEKLLDMCMKQWPTNYAAMQSCYVSRISNYREMTSAPAKAAPR